VGRKRATDGIRRTGTTRGAIRVSGVEDPSPNRTESSSVGIDVRRSPLSDAELAAIAELYGTADPKYADRTFLRQLYDAGPLGGGIHAFAHDGEAYVGHVSVIPLPSSVDGQLVSSGKYEAFAVADNARSAVTDEGVPVAVALLTSVTAAAEAQGIHLLHGITNDQIGMLLRLAGCRRVALDVRAFTGVVGTAEFADRITGWRRHALRGAAMFGGVAGMVARAGARVLYGTSAELVDAVASDVEAITASADGWTVDPTECWDWIRRVGDLRVLVIRGRRPSRVLLRPARSAGDDLHVVGWSSGRADTVTALVALASARIVGSQSRAIQVLCWQPERASAVARACRLLGFVPRPAGAFYVRARTLEPGTVGFNPFFYAVF
jgi:hypothetical protein